jgi:hypothetical protein
MQSSAYLRSGLGVLLSPVVPCLPRLLLAAQHWEATRAPTQGRDCGSKSQAGSFPFQQSWPKAINPGGLEACVREDLMDLLNGRNQLG